MLYFAAVSGSGSRLKVTRSVIVRGTKDMAELSLNIRPPAVPFCFFQIKVKQTARAVKMCLILFRLRVGWTEASQPRYNIATSQTKLCGLQYLLHTCRRNGSCSGFRNTWVVL